MSKPLPEEIKNSIIIRSEERCGNRDQEYWYQVGAEEMATQYLAEKERADRLEKALNAKMESKENRDFAYLGPEAEAALHAVYEGAEEWEGELNKLKRFAAKQMLAIRDALVEKDLNEAYHHCYLYADPTLQYMDNPWKDLEALSTQTDNKTEDNGNRL